VLSGNGCASEKGCIVFCPAYKVQLTIKELFIKGYFGALRLLRFSKKTVKSYDLPGVST